MSTVIIGGGIIGLSSAYYLSLQHEKDGVLASKPIHIIDSAPALLLSASAFAGGFLALDWFEPASSSLGALSFRLHRELAHKHDGQRRWGYAGSHTYSLAVQEVSDAKGEKVRGQDWLLDGISRSNLIIGRELGNGNSLKHDTETAILNPDGTPAVFTPQVGGTLDTIAMPEKCAQVEPKELCEFLLQECKQRGVQVHLATTATQIVRDQSGKVVSLKIQTKDGDAAGHSESFLDCNNLILAAGAWTPRVFKTLFPKSTQRVPIHSLAGHSLTVSSPRYKKPYVEESNASASAPDRWLCYSIYCAPGKYWSYAPEAYARLARGGETEIWVGGVNNPTMALPESADQVKSMTDTQSIASLRRTLVQLSGKAREDDDINEDDLTTVRESLCFRPISEVGTPYIGPVEGEDGVWIASGHGPWGITMCLGTGLVISEMVNGKETSADISGLMLP